MSPTSNPTGVTDDSLGSVVTPSSAGLLSSVMSSDSDEEGENGDHENGDEDENGDRCDSGDRDLPDTGGANRNLLILGGSLLAIGGTVVALAGRRARLMSGDDVA